MDSFYLIKKNWQKQFEKKLKNKVYFSSRKKLFFSLTILCIFRSLLKHPIELQPELWNVQSVRQMEFYYYKIRSKLQPVPLQFYMNQIESTNFKIFVSSVNPFPTKFSCDQIISVKGWKYKIDESKIFHCDYIYISMVCDLDIVNLQFYAYIN